MHVHPDIAALRGNDASQRFMQAAVSDVLDRWKAANVDLLAAFRAFGDGEAWEDLPLLSSLLDNQERAAALVETLCAGIVALMRAHPLAQLPFQHQTGENYYLLQLLQAGRATMSLSLYVPGERDACVATFSDGERHEVVLAGSADLDMLELVADHGSRAAIDRLPRRVVAGERITCWGPGASRLLRQVHEPLVVLRLARRPACPGPTRQYDLASGKIVHRASGDIRESAQEMMAAVLGRMGRSDAAPALAQAATGEGSPHFRWQALRECLALDAGEGFRALSAIAADALDPLAANAGALRAQLIEAHPALARAKDIACPA